MACYLYRGNEEFSDVGQVSICLDAATIGKRDILVGAMYSHKKDTALWLPPQVSGAGMHTLSHLGNGLPPFRDFTGGCVPHLRQAIVFDVVVAVISSN